MGKVNTTKLDNGMIGLEIIYGGEESPFGGIDASKAPRYIQPNCFADASNFLLVDNELCLCTLTSEDTNTLPPNPGVTYPLTDSMPGVLLGVGRLPCENTTKNWALYCSPRVDSGGFYHYRLVLWEQDTGATEYYNLPYYVRTKTAGLTNATAKLLIQYKNPYTVVQSVPEFTLHNATPPFNTNLTSPIAYDGKFYEVTGWNLPIAGTTTAPTPVPPGFYANNFFANSYSVGFVTGPGTPAAGPVFLPTPDSALGPPATGMVPKIIAYINARTDLPFKASSSSNPHEIVLTAFTQVGCPSVDGAAGNSLTIGGGTYTQEFGFYAVVPPAAVGRGFILVDPSNGYTDPNPFSNPSFTISVEDNFAGGTDAGQVIYTDKPIQQLTWETVGDRLFLAGWPAGYMLQFVNSTKQFSILTQYQGARTLKKMAGHLISAGMINSFDQTETNTQLWFNWSSASDLSEWNALNSANLKTGAGGAQLADISDMLTGLVVTNSIAFILRADGLSYASVLQGAAVPFDFNHVALCKDGQGCPSTALWTQFDQLGFYVGTSNVFMLAQGPQAVGDKIVEELFPGLITDSNRMSDPPPPFTLTGATDPPAPYQDKFSTKINVEPLTLPANNRIVTQFAINSNGIIWLYDPSSDSWMRLDTGPDFPMESYTDKWSILKCISLPRNAITGYDGSYQSKESYVYGQRMSSGVHQAPYMKQLIPWVSPTQQATVLFPQEEIMLGRDITIDALYVLASGIPGLEVDFTISGWQGNPSTFIPNAFSGSIIFDNQATPSVYEEYQVFNTDGQPVTLKAPQLRLRVPPQAVTYAPIVPYPINSDAYFKLPKLVMYGSFDPNQRPV